MTEGVLSQVQAEGMEFVQRVYGVTIRDKVRRNEICKVRSLEPPLWRIKRSHLRWFGYVYRMFLERLAR